MKPQKTLKASQANRQQCDKFGFDTSLAILSLSFLFTCCQQSIEDIRKEVAQNNSYSVETPMKDEYDSLCKIENDKEIFFPSKNVNYAKLTKNDFWKKSKMIKEDDLTKLLEFLNDSTNYVWGELGTPEIHYYLTYYDQNDNCIGLTTLDLEGMAYSCPMIAKMKWGMLKEMDLIDELITKYK